jgi:two-component system phosphate regulon sensor histidine kinase PhoR
MEVHRGAGRQVLTPFKWASLAIAVISSMCIAAPLLLVVQMTGGAADTYRVIACAAVAVGLALGVVHWIFSGRYTRELHQFALHVDALGHHDAEAKHFCSRCGLGELAETVHRSFSAWRKDLADADVQRRELEIRLHISEAERRHFEAVLNTMADGVVVTDAFNEVALANESAARVLQFDLADALRRPVDQVVVNRKLTNLIKDTREGGDAGLRRHVEQNVVTDDRHSIYDITLACVGSDATVGKGSAERAGTCGVVTIMRDITREKEIADMKSDFVSNVSHELRTPLSSIKAYMEMLIDGEADDEQTRAEFYNIIQGETNRLSRLIDNILNINRIESGIIRIHREQIDLSAVVREAMEVMQPQASAKQLTLIQSSGSEPCHAFADHDMILQCTLNVLSNAVKYTPAGRDIKVTVGVDSALEMAHVSVCDTGVGVPPDDLPHLFDKFYRVANHKKMAKGTGLGLNMVKHAIETVHDGKVSLVSEVGKGSTFTFELPVAGNE